MQEKLIFLHIPKTAGTSLRHSVEQEYGAENCVNVYNDSLDYFASIKDELERASVVYGHLCYGVHHALGIEGRYVTLLREPVARVISFYNHQARHADSSFFQQVNDGMSLKQLLQSELCHEVNNHQTRMISAYPHIDMVHDESVVDMAVENIKGYFDFIGTTDQIDQTVERMAGKLNWNSRPVVPEFNRSVNPLVNQVDEETLELIRYYNRLDIQLYEWVKAHYE